jgi:hypothetical protein
MSVLLAHELASHLADTGGTTRGGIGTAIPPAVRERVAPLMADAFGTTFWWALGFVVVALVVALVLLPKDKPEPLDTDGEPVEAADAALLVH